VINLVIAAVIVAVVSVAALVARRRRVDDAPTQREWHVPSQVDVVDFGSDSRIDVWSVVVFTSATCHVCSDVARKAAALASRHVTVREVEFSTARNLHEKYRIDAVPTVLIADHRGVVHRHFLGPVSATDLWAAVADVREPGRPPAEGDCSSR
jgi:hypothetical protein